MCPKCKSTLIVHTKFNLIIRNSIGKITHIEPTHHCLTCGHKWNIVSKN